MPRARHRTWAVPSLALAVMACNPPDPEVRPPDGIETFADGRLAIGELYEAYVGLRDHGWQVDIIVNSQPTGTTQAIPVIALRSPRAGPALWLLAGIHGEEPAGPIAVATAIDELREFGESHPIVLIPLCNPHGYARNWRYLNMPIYSETIEGQSVGDSSHLLPDEKDPRKPRAATASSPEADALTRYIVTTAIDYPPRYSIDLHEDDHIGKGYVYSQGRLGAGDPLATEAVRVLQESGVAIQLDGHTRFDEEIVGGIIGPVIDSSIDELMSATEILVDGRPRQGPAAGTVLVFETPAGELSLEKRAAAHLALLGRLVKIIQ